MSHEFVLGSNHSARTSDQPTVILSVDQDGPTTVIAVGKIVVHPVGERGFVRNERAIRLTPREVAILVAAVADSSIGEDRTGTAAPISGPSQPGAIAATTQTGVARS